MTIDLEQFAEEAAQEIEERPLTQPLAPRQRVFQCVFCLGSGIDRSRWRGLWGGTCWVCGGWGFLLNDPLAFRGPFAAQPGRYGPRGGSNDDAAKHGNGRDDLGVRSEPVQRRPTSRARRRRR